MAPTINGIYIGRAPPSVEAEIIRLRKQPISEKNFDHISGIYSTKKLAQEDANRILDLNRRTRNNPEYVAYYEILIKKHTGHYANKTKTGWAVFVKLRNKK